MKGEDIFQLSDEGGYDVVETVGLNKESADGADIACQLVIEYLNVTHPHTEMQTFYISPTGKFTMYYYYILYLGTFLHN